MANLSSLITVRNYKPSDRNYILSTWSRGILRAPPYKWMESDVWRKYHKRLESAIERSTILVAVNKEDEDQIVGYIVTEGEAIHWLYVKKQFRRMGLGALLMGEFKPKTYSNHTRESSWLPEKLRATYDPFTI